MPEATNGSCRGERREEVVGLSSRSLLSVSVSLSPLSPKVPSSVLVSSGSCSPSASSPPTRKSRECLLPVLVGLVVVGVVDGK